MDEFDPLTIDRDVARAARAERGWRRTLRANAEQAAQTAWFEPVRYVTTRTTFVAVADRPADDPLREALLRWLHRLAVTRIAGNVIVDAAIARQRPSLMLETPERGTFSPREIVTRVLADRDAARAGAWLEGVGDSAPLLAAERRLRESQIEITSRLGVPDDLAIATFEGDRLRNEAQEWLAKTSDVASSVLGADEDLPRLLGALVSRDVPGVWPRRPDGRWLGELFRTAPFLDGLELDLGPTPAPLGASSYARALARFGAAYARAAISTGRPFVLASDPSDVHPMRRGALFGSLLVDAVFLRRKLGLSRDAASRAARSVAATVLASVRLDAVRTLVDFATTSASAIEEAASDALKVHVPASLAGLLPRPDGRAPSRLLGVLLADGDREALRSRFDEDWFDNPRAFGFLREEDATLRPPRVPSEAFEGSAARLARVLEELLS